MTTAAVRGAPVPSPVSSPIPDEPGPPGSAPALRLDRVARRYGKGQRSVAALGPLSLTIGVGEFVCVVGGLRLRQEHTAVPDRQPRQADIRGMSIRVITG